jgi:hypothetical protein
MRGGLGERSLKDEKDHRKSVVSCGCNHRLHTQSVVGTDGQQKRCPVVCNAFEHSGQRSSSTFPSCLI